MARLSFSQLIGIGNSITIKTMSRESTIGVRLGSDVLLSSGRLRGLRVGVVCNHASVDRGFRHIVDRLAAADDVTLAAIFGPQHGFRSDVQDNMIETPHRDDPSRRVPVYSLYSETREPTAEMLRGLDVLVIDLQDIGARIYTYIYTMANCLRACGRHGVPVIVCDRPNPINGIDVEGETLVRGFESFVGLFPIPMRHGMTIGELARLFNERLRPGRDSSKSRGWKAGVARCTPTPPDLPWVMPSPNMPTLDTAIVYPGTVLFEGTMLSEGRGTTRPFELVGAPWIEAERFARDMNGLGLPGVHFRPAVFEPTFQKHAKTVMRRLPDSCHRPRGVPSRADRRGADPDVPTRSTQSHSPGGSRRMSTSTTSCPIDILAGSDTLRQQIESDIPPAAIAESWRDDEAAFRQLRQPFLLYEK